MVQCQWTTIIFEFSNMVNLRGHSCRMTKPVSNINCRLFSFASRVVYVWNILPQTAIEADSLAQFKKIVDNVNFCKFLHIKLQLVVCNHFNMLIYKKTVFYGMCVQGYICKRIYCINPLYPFWSLCFVAFCIFILIVL